MPDDRKIPTTLQREAIKGSAFSFISAIAGVSFALASVVAAARILGPAQYGRYVLITFVIPLLGVTIDFGFSGTTAWHATRRSLSRRSEMRESLRAATSFYILKAVPLGVVSFLLVGRNTVAGALAGAVVITALSGPASLALNSDRRFARQAIVSGVIAASSSCFLVLAAALTHDYRWAVFGYWAGQSIAFPLRIAMCPPDLRKAVIVPGRIKLQPEDYRFALSIWSGGLFVRWIYGRSEVLFFKGTAQQADRGRYGVTTTIAARATILSDALFGTLDVSLLALTEAAPERMNDALVRALRLSALVSITTAVLVMPGGAILAGPIFGPKYGDLRIPTIALLIASIVQTFGYVALVSVEVRRHLKALLVPSSIGAAVDLILSLTLVPRLGLIGAVIANVSAVVVHQVLLMSLGFVAQVRRVAMRCLLFVLAILLIESTLPFLPWPGGAALNALAATWTGILIAVILSFVMPKLAQPGDLAGIRALRLGPFRHAADRLLWLAGDR